MNHRERGSKSVERCQKGKARIKAFGFYFGSVGICWRGFAWRSDMRRIIFKKKKITWLLYPSMDCPKPEWRLTVEKLLEIRDDILD